jgi:hypothetical protein
VDIDFVIEVVEQACEGSVPEFVARAVLSRRGWVLRGYGDPFGLASHIDNQHCASCKEWTYSGFHMGIYDGTCGLIDDFRGDEDHCDKWRSALEV